MQQEEFQREVEEAFRAAAPRTLARRRASVHRRVVASSSGIAVSGIAVHGNNNTVQVGAAPLPCEQASPSGDSLVDALRGLWPWWWRYIAAFCICVLAMILQRQEEYVGTGTGLHNLLRILTTSFFPSIVVDAACLALFWVSLLWLVLFSWRKPRP